MRLRVIIVKCNYCLMVSHRIIVFVYSVFPPPIHCNHFLPLLLLLLVQVYSLLSVLSLSSLRISAWFINNDFNSFTITALLLTVPCYHVQLSQLVLHIIIQLELVLLLLLSLPLPLLLAYISCTLLKAWLLIGYY